MDGVVYVAFGKQYISEARRSAASLRQFCDLPTCLVSTGPAAAFDYNLLFERPDLPALLAKPVALASADLPFDRFILLDSDTLVLDDISPLFGLLERFDIAAAHCYSRWSGPGAMALPLGFVHFTTGVVVMKYDRAFLADWARRAVEHADIYGSNDQPPFTEAIYETGLNVYVLPFEFNTRIAGKVQICGKVYVIHGRGKRMEAALRSINDSKQPRIWIGKAGGNMGDLE